MDDLQTRLNEYRRKRAFNTSIAIMMYILGVAILIALAMLFPHNGGEIGVVILLVMAAAATGLIVYTHMSIPQDLVPFFDDEHPDYPGTAYGQCGSNCNVDPSADNASTAETNADGTKRIEGSTSGSGYYGCGTASSRNRPYRSPIYSSIMKLYWLIVTIFYLGISFATMAWHITWIIWLIGGAIEQAIKIIYGICTDRRY